MGRARGNMYRVKAMIEFGERQETFTIEQMVHWCNTYKTKTGRIHKQTSTDWRRMTSLLKSTDNFYLVEDNTWEYRKPKRGY